MLCVCCVCVLCVCVCCVCVVCVLCVGREKEEQYSQVLLQVTLCIMCTRKHGIFEVRIYQNGKHNNAVIFSTPNIIKSSSFQPL